MGTPIKEDPAKNCAICGEPLVRKRYNGRLEDRSVFLRRTRCSQKCANTKLDVAKDTLHWRARKHRASTCSECGSSEKLHVHHIDRNPSNNDPTNLQTLCASCHLRTHWREDREKRMATLNTGGLTARRSTDGNESSGD